MPTSAQARLSCTQALFLELSAASALWVADAASVAAKEQIRMKRDIAISDLPKRLYQAQLWLVHRMGPDAP
jgi:hypothetical protein